MNSHKMLLASINSLPPMGLFSIDMVLQWMQRTRELTKLESEYLKMELGYLIRNSPDNGFVFDTMRQPLAPVYHAEAWHQAVVILGDEE